MKKKLIEYIREESEANYSNIIDYLSEINQCGDELKAKYLGDLIWYIHCAEQEEDKKSEENKSFTMRAEEI